MQFDKISVVKFIVSSVVGIGTGKIVGKVITNHIKPETLIDKVTVTAAAWVIGAMATAATKEYTNETIDGTVKVVVKVHKGIKENLTLNKVNRGEIKFEESGLDISDYELHDGKWTKIESIEEIDGEQLLGT